MATGREIAAMPPQQKCSRDPAEFLDSAVDEEAHV